MITSQYNIDDDDDDTELQKKHFFPLTSVADVNPMSIILQLPKFPH